MMQTTTLCGRCKQQLTATTNDATTIQCPSCKFQNKIPAQRMSSQDHSNSFFVAGVVSMIKSRISGHHSENTKSASPSVASTASKRAVLIGVTYNNNKKYKLGGTIHDVKNMRKLLIFRFGFQPENILLLTETKLYPEMKHDPDFLPTKVNIQKSMRWLVDSCTEGDSLVFYFSGHGLRQPDFSDDEDDGFDETICPVDFMENGMINDNEIFTTMVEPLPQGVRLHAIVDACHSGTAMDLSYVYNREKKCWDINNKIKHTNGGFAISISACQDDQIAADSSAFTEESMSGAMTSVLVGILNDNLVITYGELLDKIYEVIDKSNQEGCCIKQILKQVFNRKLLQDAQLSASEQFDVYKRHFVL